jgi:hypothetical protein
MKTKAAYKYLTFFPPNVWAKLESSRFISQPDDEFVMSRPLVKRARLTLKLPIHNNSVYTKNL